MLRTILLLSAMLIAGSSFATNPLKKKNAEKSNTAILSEGSDLIDKELESLLELEKLVTDETLNYDEANTLYPELIDQTSVSAVADEGLLDGSDDVPLGIPGFFWGFCLGVTGMLVVYLTMDDGSDRKEQVKNAMYGCIISMSIWLVIYVALIASSV